LKQWRRQAAAAAGVPLFRVLSNATLDELARRRPQTDEDLLQIRGIGEVKLEAYGEALLNLVGVEKAEMSQTKPPNPPPVGGHE